jgi:leucyl/phenylalanyl-tRNA---protein transferase
MAYSEGAFPMADHDGVIRWYTADPRGIIPLDRFHIPQTLRQIVRQGRFEVRINTAFAEVMSHCMATRDISWINPELIKAYHHLHQLGHAHSVECYLNGKLAGGLYGVSLGAAFFGESMFHHERNASKVALVHLVRRLVERGFELLDTQATTDHLRQFGAIDITPAAYLRLLHKAIVKPRSFA